NWVGGRLNGSDLALLAQGEDEPSPVGRACKDALLQISQEFDMGEVLFIPAAATHFHSGESTSAILSRLDTALISAEHQHESEIAIAMQSDTQITRARTDIKTWDQRFTIGFQHDQFSLAAFPVVDMENRLLHEECPVRLQSGEDILSAGEFLPWINRLEKSIQLDRMVVELAIKKLKSGADNVCINLAPQSLGDTNFIDWLVLILRQHRYETSRLWLDIPEAAAYQHQQEFRTLCHELKPLNCRIGIKHMGHQLTEIGQLHDLGLDYVKIDAAFIRGIHDNGANQTLVRTLCMIVHSIGLLALAEGVHTEEEWDSLQGLGLDGATGPAVSKNYIAEDENEQDNT
ncbi:MAG: EAL domain-containing protein, partial [Pseudomonadales bacterium]